MGREPASVSEKRRGLFQLPVSKPHFSPAHPPAPKCATQELLELNLPSCPFPHCWGREESGGGELAVVWLLASERKLYHL